MGCVIGIFQINGIYGYTKNDSLKLIPEPTNDNDPNAVGIYTQSGKHLGYVPNFYTKAVFSLLKNGATPSVRVAILMKSQPLIGG